MYPLMCKSVIITIDILGQHYLTDIRVSRNGIVLKTTKTQLSYTSVNFRHMVVFYLIFSYLILSYSLTRGMYTCTVCLSKHI